VNKSREGGDEGKKVFQLRVKGGMGASGRPMKSDHNIVNGKEDTCDKRRRGGQKVK